MQTAITAESGMPMKILGLSLLPTRDPREGIKQVNIGFIDCKQTCNTCQTTFIQAEPKGSFIQSLYFLLHKKYSCNHQKNLCLNPK